jgi:hypothetical protein
MSATINNTIIADRQALLLIAAKFRCKLGIERLLTQKLASATKLFKTCMKKEYLTSNHDELNLKQGIDVVVNHKPIRKIQKYHQVSGICTQRKETNPYLHISMPKWCTNK